jgi:hypothetical protein
MSDVKQKILAIINNMPEEATIDDILDAIRLQKQVMTGLHELDSGQFITHDQMKEELINYLKGTKK